ncbi:MAG: hypothetical protein ACK4Z6_06490 [Candidatus Methylomirabilales bacterium]
MMKRLLIPFLFVFSSSAFGQQIHLPPIADEEAVLCSPFLTEEGLVRVGVILRPMAENLQISLLDQVFISLREGGKASVGDRYTVMREGPPVFHPLTGAFLGRRVKVLGVVEVVDVEGSHARARVVVSCDVIAPGDALLRYSRPEFPFTVQAAPTDLKVGGFIVGSKENLAVLGMRDLVFIDLGLDHGIGPGDIFAIFQEPGFSVDPTTGRRILLPPVLVGEGMVLKASSQTAAVIITQSARQIRVGDPVSLIRKIP